MKQITLPVHGHTMTFSESELIAIIEKYVVARTPTPGKLFQVYPLAIDQNLFQEIRSDYKQEIARLLILEAFAEVERNPKRYGKNFMTMMPRVTWSKKITVKELKEKACELGDHNANWVEQALEWAQRIANGEPWENICNKRDMANWPRIVIWKDGLAHLVGGSGNNYSCYPASMVVDWHLSDDCSGEYCIPLVVLYK